MGDVRIKIEFPDGKTSDPEIWPDACTVGQMLPRVLADARERDKSVGQPGKDWGLVLKESGTSLGRDLPLARLGVTSGATLILRDEMDVRAKKAHYVSYGRMLVDSGFIDDPDVKELARLSSLASLDRAAAGAALTEAGVDQAWVGRLLAGKPFISDELASYRKALQSVARDKPVPEDMLRTLSKLRSTSKIAPDRHKQLCQRLGFKPELANKLLEELPPKEDGLAAYRKELDFLKKQEPTSTEELKPLARVRQQFRIAPADHARLALEVGFTSSEAQLLWDGIPPKLEQQAEAEERYKEELKKFRLDRTLGDQERKKLVDLRHRLKVGSLPRAKIHREIYLDRLKTAWFDKVIQPQEKEELAHLRVNLEISDDEHRRVGKELNIPDDQIARMLTRPASGGCGLAVIGVLLLVAGGYVEVAMPAGTGWPEFGWILVAAGLGFLLYGIGSRYRTCLVVALLVGAVAAAVLYSVPPGGGRRPDGTDSNRSPVSPRTVPAPGSPAGSEPAPVVTPVAQWPVLDIRTNPPGAQIFIDDVEAGLTPRRLTVTPGIRRVVLRRKKYDAIEKVFDLKAGDLEVIDETLRRRRH